MSQFSSPTQKKGASNSRCSRTSKDTKVVRQAKNLYAIESIFPSLPRRFSQSPDYSVDKMSQVTKETRLKKIKGNNQECYIVQHGNKNQNPGENDKIINPQGNQSGGRGTQKPRSDNRSNNTGSNQSNRSKKPENPTKELLQNQLQSSLDELQQNNFDVIHIIQLYYYSFKNEYRRCVYISNPIFIYYMLFNLYNLVLYKLSDQNLENFLFTHKELMEVLEKIHFKEHSDEPTINFNHLMSLEMALNKVQVGFRKSINLFFDSIKEQLMKIEKSQINLMQLTKDLNLYYQLIQNNQEDYIKKFIYQDFQLRSNIAICTIIIQFLNKEGEANFIQIPLYGDQQFLNYSMIQNQNKLQTQFDNQVEIDQIDNYKHIQIFLNHNNHPNHSEKAIVIYFFSEILKNESKIIKQILSQLNPLNQVVVTNINLRITSEREVCNECIYMMLQTPFQLIDILIKKLSQQNNIKFSNQFYFTFFGQHLYKDLLNDSQENSQQQQNNQNISLKIYFNSRDKLYKQKGFEGTQFYSLEATLLDNGAVIEESDKIKKEKRPKLYLVYYNLGYVHQIDENIFLHRYCDNSSYTEAQRSYDQLENQITFFFSMKSIKTDSDPNQQGETQIKQQDQISKRASTQNQGDQSEITQNQIDNIDLNEIFKGFKKLEYNQNEQNIFNQQSLISYINKQNNSQLINHLIQLNIQQLKRNSNLDDYYLDDFNSLLNQYRKRIKQDSIFSFKKINFLQILKDMLFLLSKKKQEESQFQQIEEQNFVFLTNNKNEIIDQIEHNNKHSIENILNLLSKFKNQQPNMNFELKATYYKKCEQCEALFKEKNQSVQNDTHQLKFYYILNDDQLSQEFCEDRYILLDSNYQNEFNGIILKCQEYVEEQK